MSISCKHEINDTSFCVIIPAFCLETSSVIAMLYVQKNAQRTVCWAKNLSKVVDSIRPRRIFSGYCNGTVSNMSKLSATDLMCQTKNILSTLSEIKIRHSLATAKPKGSLCM